MQGQLNPINAAGSNEYGRFSLCIIQALVAVSALRRSWFDPRNVNVGFVVAGCLRVFRFS
jgi:hypothetical protein